MLKFILFPMLILVIIFSCRESSRTTIISILESQESIDGNPDYINSPFVAAGDRVYIVGHQDGSFPDLGWHVTGEMGGVWDHPVKLMDGYSLNLRDQNGLDWCLDAADSFTNFPVGNVHTFKNEVLTVRRYQFVPDGVEGAVIVYRIRNGDTKNRFVDLTFTGMIDLSPVWLWDSLGITDGMDGAFWNMEEQMVVAKDSLNNWFTVFGTDLPADYHYRSPCKADRRGLGLDVSLTTSFEIEAGSFRDVAYYIAGSATSLEAARHTFGNLKENTIQLLNAKVERYGKLSSVTSLASPDEDIDQMYRWIKFNTDWLVRDVPDQGRAMSAGIPDYPWWFGTDNGYILQGLLSAGMHEEALATIDLIMQLSREVNNENGRIMHEASTNGVVYNPGNLNTTPYFIYALWRAYEWTGDPAIPENYYEDVKKGIAWIEAQDKDKNGYPDGPGMMEIHGLHTEMIDVVAYLAKAYQAAANFAMVNGDQSLMEEYQSKSEILIEKINTEWWVEEFNSYADFRATKKQAMALIDAAIVRADTINKPWSVEELNQTREDVRQLRSEELRGYVVHHNWVVNTPMEMGLAEPAKAKIALETAKKYRNRFGMFVTGIDRNEEQEKAEKWKSFSYVGAVMTLPTGVQAIAEAKYGNPDETLNYLEMLGNSFSYALPGSMYEVSPDFGMIAQGWNIYAVAVPIVNHFFGVYPNAFDKRIYISPDFPSAWEDASIEDIMIGDNYLDISFSKSGDVISYTVSQDRSDWEITFEIREEGKLILNDEPVQIEQTEGIYTLNLSGEKNVITILL